MIAAYMTEAYSPVAEANFWQPFLPWAIIRETGQAARFRTLPQRSHEFDKTTLR